MSMVVQLDKTEIPVVLVLYDFNGDAGKQFGELMVGLGEIAGAVHARQVLAATFFLLEGESSHQVLSIIVSAHTLAGIFRK